MKKIVVFIVMFFIGIISVQAVDFKSKNIVLYNINEDLIMFEKGIDDEVKIASITKVMTVYVALENIKDIKEKVILKDEVFVGLVEQNAAVAGFEPGDEVTYEDLLYGAMMPSGADATRGLGINLFGSEDNFVKKMNEKAKELGMKNTVFANTSGLEEPDREQKATLRDILTLMKTVKKDEDFMKIITASEYKTSNGKKTFKSSWKKLSADANIDMSFVLGGKTGYTTPAGLCFASFAEFDGNEFILINVNAPREGSVSANPTHLLDSSNIYKYYFNLYGNKVLLKKDTIVASIPIKYGKEKFYNAKSLEEVIKYIEKDIKGIEYKYKGVELLDSSYKKGDRLGVYEVYVDDQLIDSIEVFLDRDITFSFLTFILNNYFFWFGIVGILVIMLIIVVIRNKKVAKKMVKNNENKKLS